MSKQAKGFSLANIDANEAFDLEKDGKEADAQAEVHKLAQATENNVSLNDANKPAVEEEASIRLDIDAVDLIKVKKTAKKKGKESKKSKRQKTLEAYRQLHKAFTIGHSVPIREKQTFYELIAVMVESGIPIVKAIKVYAEQTTHKYFQKVCRSITYQLEKGQKFSETLVDYPRIFTESERGIIASSEATGRLVDALRRLGSEVEKSAALRAKVRGALIYPSVVIVFVIITVFVLLRFVVPQISEIFISAGLELPTITQVVIGASRIMVDYSLLFMGGAIALVAGNYLLYRIKKIRYYYHLLMLKIPTFGIFQKDYAQASFARSLANLVSSGVGIVQTLEITAKSIGNLVYQEKVELLSKDVANGITIGDSLANSPYFSDMFVSMIAVAEQTAQIDNIAIKLASYYTEKVNNMADNLSKLLQPIIIGVVGIIVGVIVIAIMLPMSQIIGSIGSL